ncbi:hypothetical protein [Clostridium cibarium]|uniref:Uncharacterized protein n=1 Tax=Clostridium cibarium TaxID=2762247 RepID=A0ABR8PQ16_9CLOT|nr:hypothetical protein [Clostridium cibarium]MBD7910274.1 hypothetical protein [Clostridium cibarium]
MAYYIKNNPDVANFYGNDHNGVINHFLVSGMKEGRVGSEDFNIKVYKKNYKDLEKAFGGDNKAYFDHYLQCGIAEGRIAK